MGPRPAGPHGGGPAAQGRNYYGRYGVRFDPSTAATLMGRHAQEENIRTEHVDRGDPSPDGLTRQLLRFAQLRIPLYVTENGVFDDEDRIRPGFLVDHIRAVHTACIRGADVRGHFHWWMIDDFEWTEGLVHPLRPHRPRLRHAGPQPPRQRRDPCPHLPRQRPGCFIGDRPR